MMVVDRGKMNLSAGAGRETITSRARPPRGGLPSSAVVESNRMRILAKRYLRYSDSTSLVVAPFDHHGSMRKRSETTG